MKVRRIKKAPSSTGVASGSPCSFSHILLRRLSASSPGSIPVRQKLVLGLKRKESCLNLGHAIYELQYFFSESGVFKLFFACRCCTESAVAVAITASRLTSVNIQQVFLGILSLRGWFSHNRGAGLQRKAKHAVSPVKCHSASECLPGWIFKGRLFLM